MNILCIGPTSNQCHVGENLYNSFKKMNHNVFFCGREQVLKIPAYQPYITKILNNEVAVKLSEVIKHYKNNYDFIFIDEGHFTWENDITAPVIMYQREFYRPPKVFYPTIALFFHSAIVKHFWSFARYWMHRVKLIRIFPNAADFQTYHAENKEHKGVSMIGFRENLTPDYVNQMVELTKLAAHTELNNRYEEFKKTGLTIFDTPISNDRYRYLLARCEANWIPISPFQFTTRRIIEAMACKTVCIIKVDGSRHMEILRELGYEPNIHYFPINTIHECLDVHRILKRNPELGMQISNAAFNITKALHSYDVRAKYLIHLVNNL